MDSREGRRHPKWEDVYTPLNDRVMEMLEELYVRYGTWREVCYQTGINMKVMRRIRKKERKTIGSKLMDRILTPTGVRVMSDFEWFTPDDLIKLGIWDDVEYIDEKDGWVPGGKWVKGES